MTKETTPLDQSTEYDFKGLAVPVPKLKQALKDFKEEYLEEINNTFEDIQTTWIDSGTISKFHKVWLIENLNRQFKKHFGSLADE